MPALLRGSESDNLDNILQQRVLKKNRLGIVSSDEIFRGRFTEFFIGNHYNVRPMGLESLLSSGEHDAYFIDLSGFDDYRKIMFYSKKLREESPDSEIVFLQEPSINIRPPSILLQMFIKKNSIFLFERPSKENENYEAHINTLITEINCSVEEWRNLPNIAKIGGSIIDLYDRTPDTLIRILKEMDNLHEQGYNIVLSVGGGPRNDRESELANAYGITPDTRTALERNAINIAELLGTKGQYISPDKIRNQRFSKSYLRRSIPVVALSGSRYIPDNDSDSHTIELGERLKVHKVIFIKDTDGVFKEDPYKAFKHDTKIFFKLYPLRIGFESPNPFFPFIYSNEILNGKIDRIDINNKGEHLIQTPSLVYLNNETENVRAVQIVNGNKPELFKYAFDGKRYTSDGKYVGSFILKG